MSKKTLRERVGRWLNPGPKLPTHAQKQAVVREFARRYDLKYLVETGTCHGDMVAAMQGEFKKSSPSNWPTSFTRKSVNDSKTHLTSN